MNCCKNKSVLDNMKIKEEGFPLSTKEGSSKLLLGVVSQCPTCGAPIYGPTQATAGEPVAAQYSCNCRASRDCCGG